MIMTSNARPRDLKTGPLLYLIPNDPIHVRDMDVSAMTTTRVVSGNFTLRLRKVLEENFFVLGQKYPLSAAAPIPPPPKKNEKEKERGEKINENRYEFLVRKNEKGVTTTVSNKVR